MLYFVPTPIGNLSDMTYRAVQVLQEVDIILAEDTRKTGILLKHFEIDTPMQSFHSHNEHQHLNAIVEQLSGGKTYAIVSDAGSPAISDPGFLLSRACREHKIDITVLPGASALIPAITASGLPCDNFIFAGFLPVKKKRNQALTELSNFPYTFVLYESPYRMHKTLSQLAEFCGLDRAASVSKEISKIHEEHMRGTLGELLEIFTSSKKVKGEYVIVVAGTS